MGMGKPRALSSISQGQLLNQVTKNIAGVNPLSNRFVLKESENNLNLALAHLNMPNAQQVLQ